MVIKFTDDAADRSDRYFEKMPTQYPQEAVDLCRKIYCKYGGNNADAIEREMRKVYPGWRRNNLNDRGKERRLGSAGSRSMDLKIAGAYTCRS
jgi:hypothetical protein